MRGGGLELRALDAAAEKEVKKAEKLLETRGKEVLRSDAHECANYLVSINLLQEMGSRP